VREVWQRIGWTGGTRIYGLLVGLLSLVVTARVLGPAGRGEVAAALTWAALFSTVGYLSLGQVALHRATARREHDWLRETLGPLLAVAGVATAAGWVVAVVLHAATDGRVYGGLPLTVLALGMLALPFLVWEQYGSSLLMAMDRLSTYNRAQVVGRTLGLVVLLVLLGIDLGVAAALLAAVVAQATVAAGGFRWLLRQAGSTALDRDVVKQLLIGGAKLHLNAVGTFLYLNASVLLVQYYRGSVETGQFQVVVHLTSIALILPQAASMVLYGEVAKLGPDAAWPANRRVLLLMSAGAAAGAVVTALLAPVLVPFLLGEDFRPAVPVLQLMTLALVGQTFSTVMAPQWIGRGLFVQASAITLAVGILNLGACLALIPRYGMEGAAAAAVGVYAVSLVGNGILAVVAQRSSTRSRAAAPTST